jgi:hypothetical protein
VVGLTSVTIRVRSGSAQDPYLRFHGLAIDQPLNDDFWNSQPEKVLGTSGKIGNFTKTLDLPSGEHTLEYATSADAGYMWNAVVTVDRRPVAYGRTDRRTHIKGSFTVGSSSAIFGSMAEKGILPTLRERVAPVKEKRILA